MWAGREESGVNGGMKKWVGLWPKREELLRNGLREEIWLPMTIPGTDSGCETGCPSCKTNVGPAMGRAIGE